MASKKKLKRRIRELVSEREDILRKTHERYEILKKEAGHLRRFLRSLGYPV